MVRLMTAMLFAAGTLAFLPAAAQDAKGDSQQQRVHEANQQIEQEVKKGNFTPQEAKALELNESPKRSPPTPPARSR